MKANLHSKTQKAMGWLAAAMAVAILPKCVLCVVAYAAALLGVGRMGVELCGGVSPSADIAWPAGLVAVVVLIVARAVRKILRGVS